MQQRNFSILLQMISNKYKKNSPTLVFFLRYITTLNKHHNSYPALPTQNVDNEIINTRLIYYQVIFFFSCLLYSGKRQRFSGSGKHRIDANIIDITGKQQRCHHIDVD